MSTSGIPKELSKLIAKKHREDYRREHGRNPQTGKELFDSVKNTMDKMTPKDFAALNVRIARADVAHLEMFSRTPMERINAQRDLEIAERKYQETPGKETPRTLSLREKVVNLLSRDKEKNWRVREIAEALDHPPSDVGIVVSFLRKENRRINVVK